MGVLGSIVGSALLSFSAYAAEIHFCAKPRGGIYLANTSSGTPICKRGNALFTMNSEGSQGPQGAKGDQGFPGLRGEQGPRGDSGPRGEKGDRGDVGPQGLQGEAGLTGRNGSTLHLVDGNGQDLGLFLDNADNGERLTAYNPEVGVLFRFTQTNGLGGGEYIQSVDLNPGAGGVVYLQLNCAGAPYLTGSTNVHGFRLVAGQFFTPTADPMISAQYSSTLELNGNCRDVLSGPTELFPLQEIVPPFFLPLAWPLSVVEME